MNRLKDQFLATLNHEVRTPLSGIMGMTDLLLETDLDHEQSEYTAAIRNCAETLHSLFNAALDFSDLSAGRLGLEEMEFDLPGAIGDTVSLFAARAEAKRLELSSRLDSALPPVAVGDPFRFRQLLSQLIDNAIKFTQKGQIQIEASRAPAGDAATFSLVVAVKDTGIGIASERLSSVFDAFHQLDSGLSREYPGIGLGLALAKKIAHLMGGEISVESESGVGSVFTCCVPLGLTPASPSLSSDRSRGDRTVANRPLILVVDDNPIAQRVASHTLRKRKYEVDCVASGCEAVQAASGTRYDLILMDLQMPGMNGLETTNAIRKLPGYDSVPVVALTANTSDEYRHFCVGNGMQGFLSKPIQSNMLIDAVETLLAGAGTL